MAKRRVAVIGAGAMGLAAAYHAAKAGHEVTLFEAAPEPGGMAAHFDFGGLSIERFYHFVCKADQPTFDLLDELGIGDSMRWRPTSMGYFIDGKLHPWGNPIALLRFPGLDLISKLRYGALMFLSTRREFEQRALEALDVSRLYVLTMSDALDIETLRLFGMLGSEASAGALAQVDLLAALSSPEANDIVNFSLEILPSVLETKTRPAAGTTAAHGYSGLGTRGSIDSMVLTELAWEPKVMLRDGLERTIAYFEGRLSAGDRATAGQAV